MKGLQHQNKLLSRITVNPQVLLGKPTIRDLSIRFDKINRVIFL
ncbi:hypothetical protein HRbin07_00292 [bacterium HR07]|nr:hypothetical protein HRbin07_00292 [bacterium HR07]